jgi:hypothetical protein
MRIGGIALSVIDCCGLDDRFDSQQGQGFLSSPCLDWFGAHPDSYPIAARVKGEGD